MIKCVDKGMFTCIGRNGTPKREFPSAEAAISAAKWANDKFPDEFTKQVGYKCTHCQKYHLTTVQKRQRK